MRRRNLRIRAMCQRSFIRSTLSDWAARRKCVRTFLVEPLHGEVGACLGAIAATLHRRRGCSAHANVDVSSVIDQALDEVEVVRVRRTDGIVATVDAPVA